MTHGVVENSNAFPLDAYLERIGYAGRVAPDEQTLDALQRAQLAAIPFENFDILLGSSISLQPAALFAKLVEQPRGGYCFELNGLFLSALRTIGFTVRPLLARVHLRGVPTRRTHELLLVELDERSWVADVGFGGPSLRAPIPLELGTTRRQRGEVLRLVEAGAFGTMLQRQGADGWQDLYSFELDTATAHDIECANRYTATHPQSRFTTTRIAAIHEPNGRTTLEDLRLRRITEGVAEETVLAEGPAYLDALAQYFGIDLGVPYDALQPLARS